MAAKLLSLCFVMKTAGLLKYQFVEKVLLFHSGEITMASIRILRPLVTQGWNAQRRAWTKMVARMSSINSVGRIKGCTVRWVLRSFIVCPNGSQVMRRMPHVLLVLTIFLVVSPAFAKDEKCSALSKLGATIYANKDRVNEYQMLRGMERTSKQIDFAFIQLFSGIAYSLNALPAPEFQLATGQFCQSIVAAALAPASVGNQADTSNCKSLVDHAHLINTFRQSGDTPASLRRFFEKTYGEHTSVHRVVADYLNLMGEMRFSNLLHNRSDEDFVNFSRRACQAFETYVNTVERKR